MNDKFSIYDNKLRFIGAVYFALFAVAFTLLTKYCLYIFNTGVPLPFFSTTLLSLLLGAFFGGVFSPHIATANSTGHVFVWGMLLAIAITPFYTIGLQIIYYLHQHSMYNNLHQWQDYLVLYGVLLLFFILIAGIWFIPLMGFAALQFNRRFLPGYQAYLKKQQSRGAKNQ